MLVVLGRDLEELQVSGKPSADAEKPHPGERALYVEAAWERRAGDTGGHSTVTAMLFWLPRGTQQGPGVCELSFLYLRYLPH